jgi:hypothetical protein
MGSCQKNRVRFFTIFKTTPVGKMEERDTNYFYDQTVRVFSKLRCKFCYGPPGDEGSCSAVTLLRRDRTTRVKFRAMHHTRLRFSSSVV